MDATSEFHELPHASGRGAGPGPDIGESRQNYLDFKPQI
jgi:hypothetical protein